MKNHQHTRAEGAPAEEPTLILGGAGFIGTNLAHRILSDGKPVLLFDNLSRPGVERNLDWLRGLHGGLLGIEVGDKRDAEAVARVVQRASRVFDFAAQVAVTTSLSDPVHDFEVNARGTLNVLEAIRARSPVPLVFTSTNKVYGRLKDVRLQAGRERYEPVGGEECEHGFDEDQPLDFHSPYGCSKGAAEQYVLDYARTFGIPATVFRMSCIYGPHQFGTEDQGWVAHFLIRTLEGEPITVFGDGKQVRDILYVEDLVEALLLAQQHIGSIRGRAFNIGGGPCNTTSLLELAGLIVRALGEEPKLRFAGWRPADQQFYVSDIRRFHAATGWSPKVPVEEGVSRLVRWLLENRSQLRTVQQGVEAAHTTGIRGSRQVAAVAR